MTKGQERALSARRNNGEGPAADEARRDYGDATDPQLERALDALKGMMIYKQQMASRQAAEKRS